MAATLAATPTPSALPNSHEFDVNGTKRDVVTELYFLKRLDHPVEAIDLRLPDVEEHFQKLDDLNQLHQVIVHDIRGEEAKYTLDKNGFQYIPHEVKELQDWSNEEEVERVLIPATDELVKRATGAFKTILFKHRIRNKAEDKAKRQDSVAPAHSVHSDMTPIGAMNTLKNIVKDNPAELDSLLKTRIMVMNVWRPLKTIQKDPLTVCDWTTVDAKNDLAGSRLIWKDGSWHEFGKVHFSERQKWFYLGGQRPDEALLFKQFDSKVENGVSLPHSAFVDSQFATAEPRESIEIKMFAFISE